MKKFSIYFLFILSIYPVMAFGQQPPNGAGEIYGTVFQKDLEQRVASAQIRIAGTNQRVTTDPNGGISIPRPTRRKIYTHRIRFRLPSTNGYRRHRGAGRNDRT